MPQSLLAFLAMMIASIATLNQYSAQMETYDQMVRSEFELMANAVVIERMEIIAAGTAFDDLQDLDGTQPTGEFDPGGSAATTFQLSISVQYTDEDGNAVAGPTDYQEVTIVGSHARYGIALVTHSRLFSD